MFCPRLVDRHNSCLSTTEDTYCLALVFSQSVWCCHASLHTCSSRSRPSGTHMASVCTLQELYPHPQSFSEGWKCSTSAQDHVHLSVPLHAFLYAHCIWVLTDSIPFKHARLRSSLFMHVPWGVPLIPSLFFKGVFSTQRSMVNEEHLNASTHFTHSCNLMSFCCV